MSNGTKTIITILSLLIIGLITFIVTDAIINSNSKNSKKNENTVSTTEDKSKTGDVSAKGADEKEENESKVSKYSKTELEKLSLDYYEAKTGYRPGKVASEVNEEGKLAIQLYDSFSDHNSTCDWYTIDMNTGKGTNITGDIIDLTNIPEKTKKETDNANKSDKKDENTTTKKANNTTKTTTQSTNKTTTTSKTLTPAEEIKKALKDEKWLKENVMITEDDWGGSRSEQLLSFMIVKGNTTGPMVLVQSLMQEPNISKGTVVFYKNGKVVAYPIRENITYDGMIKADPNKAIIRIEENLALGTQYRVIDIKNGIPQEIDTYGYYNGGEHEGEWYFKEDFYRAVPTISEDEYFGIARHYSNSYSFYTIGTMLTNENIDKYVK